MGCGGDPEGPVVSDVGEMDAAGLTGSQVRVGATDRLDTQGQGAGRHHRRVPLVAADDLADQADAGQRLVVGEQGSGGGGCRR